MEYKFFDTTNGPVIAGEDEVLFFNDFGPIQEYYDADPEFFNKAYDFFIKTMELHVQLLVDGIKGESPLSAQTVVSKLHMYVGASEALKQFERSVKGQEEHSH